MSSSQPRGNQTAGSALKDALHKTKEAGESLRHGVNKGADDNIQPSAGGTTAPYSGPSTTHTGHPTHTTVTGQPTTTGVTGHPTQTYPVSSSTHTGAPPPGPPPSHVGPPSGPPPSQQHGGLAQAMRNDPNHAGTTGPTSMNSGHPQSSEYPPYPANTGPGPATSAHPPAAGTVPSHGTTSGSGLGRTMHGTTTDHGMTGGSGLTNTSHGTTSGHGITGGSGLTGTSHHNPTTTTTHAGPATTTTVPGTGTSTSTGSSTGNPDAKSAGAHLKAAAMDLKNAVSSKGSSNSNTTSRP